MDPDAASIYCPACDYDLRGAASARCPECGLELSERDLHATMLPWAHRRRIGRVRAYLRTLRIVALRPAQLSQEAHRGLRLDDALRFRRVTVQLAAIWPCVSVMYFAIRIWRRRDKLFGDHALEHVNFMCEAAVLLATLTAVVLLLMGIAGVASYFFHPSHRPMPLQNSAVAMSYYLCAPLAAWLPCGIGVCTYRYLQVAQWHAPYALVAAAEAITFTMAVVVAGALLWQWAITVIHLRQTAKWSLGATTLIGALLPVMWALLVAVAALLPAAIAYVSIVILSLL